MSDANPPVPAPVAEPRHDPNVSDGRPAQTNMSTGNPADPSAIPGPVPATPPSQPMQAATPQQPALTGLTAPAQASPRGGRPTPAQATAPAPAVKVRPHRAPLGDVVFYSRAVSHDSQGRPTEAEVLPAFVTRVGDGDVLDLQVAHNDAGAPQPVQHVHNVQKGAADKPGTWFPRS